jgi:hypothetical protein
VAPHSGKGSCPKLRTLKGCGQGKTLPVLSSATGIRGHTAQTLEQKVGKQVTVQGRYGTLQHRQYWAVTSKLQGCTQSRQAGSPPPHPPAPGISRPPICTRPFPALLPSGVEFGGACPLCSRIPVATALCHASNDCESEKRARLGWGLWSCPVMPDVHMNPRPPSRIRHTNILMTELLHLPLLPLTVGPYTNTAGFLSQATTCVCYSSRLTAVVCSPWHHADLSP